MSFILTKMSMFIWAAFGVYFTLISLLKHFADPAHYTWHLTWLLPWDWFQIAPLLIIFSVLMDNAEEKRFKSKN